MESISRAIGKERGSALLCVDSAEGQRSGGEHERRLGRWGSWMRGEEQAIPKDWAILNQIVAPSKVDRRAKDSHSVKDELAVGDLSIALNTTAEILLTGISCRVVFA